MTLRITTWNVNGLRAVLNRGDLAPVIALEPDILMLQEVKSRPDQIHEDHRPSWQDRQECWNPAERPGYSGVACFYLTPPLEVKIGLGDERFDREGRVIQMRYPNFTVMNAYFPSGQRDYGRVLFKLEFYARLLDLSEQIHARGEQIIIGGDFNTAHQEIDLRNPRQNQKTSGFLPEERQWVSRYLSSGFVDAYRYLYPDQIQYTWWTYVSSARSRNVGWRLDYFLISESLAGSLQDVIIHDDIQGSDHCPVSLILKS
jgi:exodeoxyribonuclease III